MELRTLTENMPFFQKNIVEVS